MARVMATPASAVLNLGHLVLAGGAEFGGRMAALDRRALELAGGAAASVHIIPAAAAPDHNQDRAGARGVQWFRSIGATKVFCREIIDRASADDDSESELLGTADLIYLLGGFPAHLAESLQGTRSWQAAIRAYASGAVIAGSSAGAMVLGDLFYDPGKSAVRPGLGLIGPVLVIPHHQRTGATWAARLQSLAPDLRLLGLDESTGIIDDAESKGWTVYGGGEAVVYLDGGQHCYRSGQVIPFTRLPPPRADPGNQAC
jgi:cyanophycinase